MKEVEAFWGDLVIGSLIKAPRGPWRVIDMAHPAQIEYGMSLWLKVRSEKTGEEHAIEPRKLTSKVTIIDEGIPPAGGLPSDSERIALLVEKLGAVGIATRDNATGEVTCDMNGPWGGGWQRWWHTHLELAHGFDVSNLSEDVKEIVEIHGRAHNPKYPTIGKGGFPHRHVPEDLSIL